MTATSLFPLNLIACVIIFAFIWYHLSNRLDDRFQDKPKFNKFLQWVLGFIMVSSFLNSFITFVIEPMELDARHRKQTEQTQQQNERIRVDSIVTDQLSDIGYNAEEIRSFLAIDHVSIDQDKLTLKHHGDIDSSAMEKLNTILATQQSEGLIDSYFVDRHQTLGGNPRNRQLHTEIVILINLKSPVN